MAMVRVTPTEVRVRCGWVDGRPRSIHVADEDLPVVRIEHVREESAAYPAARGPRTIFEVSTSDARLRLAYEHRRRRWLLEGLDRDRSAQATLRRAA
ncbi:MAG TPA: hypothetical protein VK992_04305 [Candidatus Caenarcaniphilales bacterium]|nr:hypothetical protein [Candidatus Caenarcaniphilales bacterium]